MNKTHQFFRLLILTIFASSLVIVPGCKNSGKNKNTISISGAFALYPMAVRWAEEYQKLHPDVKINISAGGAGKGMTDALSQMVDLGMFSKEVSKEEKSKGAWWIAVAKDAVVATISPKNPVFGKLSRQGLTKEKFYNIFIKGDLKTWGEATASENKDAVHVYTRSDACGAAEVWAKYLNNQKQEDLKGIGVNGDPGVADAVRKDPLGIGYNNLAFAYNVNTNKKYDGIEVVPIDINGNGKIDPDENFYGNLKDLVNAIKTGKYPSPPSRNLYFVSKNKPANPAVLDFLKWILTDGQKYVDEAGYVKISAEDLQTEQKKLK